MELTRHMKAYLRHFHRWGEYRFAEMETIPVATLAGRPDEQIAWAEMVRAIQIGLLIDWIRVGPDGERRPDDRSSWQSRESVKRLSSVASAAFWLRWDDKRDQEAHRTVDVIGFLDRMLASGSLVVDGASFGTSLRNRRRPTRLGSFIPVRALMADEWLESVRARRTSDASQAGCGPALGPCACARSSATYNWSVNAMSQSSRSPAAARMPRDPASLGGPNFVELDSILVSPSPVEGSTPSRSPPPLPPLAAAALEGLPAGHEQLAEAAAPKFAHDLAYQGGRGSTARHALAQDVAVSQSRLRCFQSLQAVALGGDDLRRVLDLERLIAAEHNRFLSTMDTLARLDPPPITAVRITAHQAAVQVNGR